MNEVRAALLIGAYDFADRDLRRLRAPTGGVDELARVLRDENIGPFTVELPVIDQPAQVVR